MPRWGGAGLVVLMLWTPTAATAQSASATIAGTVRDSTGRVLLGVRVVLRNAETGETRQTTSGGAGQYEFPALLPASIVTLGASLDGFRPVQRAVAGLAAGERRLINLPLQLAGVGETVEVTADPSVGRTSSPELGGHLPREPIDRLPLNGRDLIALAYLIPRAAPARGFYNLASRLTVNGASSLVTIFNVFDRTNFSEFFNYGVGGVRPDKQGTLAFQPTHAGPARQFQFTARVLF